MLCRSWLIAAPSTAGERRRPDFVWRRSRVWDKASVKIPVISAMKRAVVRNALVAAAVALAALLQPLHSLDALRAAPTEAAVAVRALPAVAAAHTHDDCDTAPKPVAAVCALACAAAIAVLTPPVALIRPERLAEPASRQPPLRRGRHHSPDPRPPRPVA